MNSTQPLPDDALLAAFESCELPFEQWTHDAHLRVATLYLRKLSLADAIDELRRRIRAYNDAHGVPTTPERGYHETITCAWANIIAAAVHRADPTLTSLHFVRAHPEWAEPSFLRRFYSADRLASPAARASFVAPDLAVLPLI